MLLPYSICLKTHFSIQGHLHSTPPCTFHQGPVFVFACQLSNSYSDLLSAVYFCISSSSARWQLPTVQPATWHLSSTMHEAAMHSPPCTSYYISPQLVYLYHKYTINIEQYAIIYLLVVCTNLLLLADSNCRCHAGREPSWGWGCSVGAAARAHPSSYC